MGNFPCSLLLRCSRRRGGRASKTVLNLSFFALCWERLVIPISVERMLLQIRNKSSHHRGIEEKQWVALDILINKHLYKALSVVENEEMQLNDEYKTELQADDVTRILGLPHEIQLALPHMKSSAEVHAHKLLTTYTLEHGDAEFAEADEQSQDHLFSTMPSEVRFVPKCPYSQLYISFKEAVINLPGSECCMPILTGTAYLL